MKTATPSGPALRVSPRPALLDRPHTALLRHSPVRPPGAVPVRDAYPLKAFLDYTLAVLLAVVGLPVCLLCMLAVKLTSRGPAMYSQTRVGRGGRIFVMYKIRTMEHDCEKVSGIQWSTANDPRITPLGRVLRALHLDELPQLWNVLKGDMSLIGPRPERPEIVDDLRLSVCGYDARHAVKPGITGFAQVHLPPDSSLRTVQDKLVYDRFYIGRMSLGMDLCILWYTALKVAGLKNLYHRPPRTK